MGERPERIWLLHDTDDGGGDTWCEDRNPTEEPDEDVPATEYVRADVHRARVAALEADKAQLVAALEPLARRASQVDDGSARPPAAKIGGAWMAPVMLSDLQRARAELDAVKEDRDG